MVLEHFINLNRNLFAAEYSILTWRFMSSSSSKYWFMRIPKYLTLSENLILVPERKIGTQGLPQMDPQKSIF